MSKIDTIEAKISVVMPLFNDELYLRNTLESLVNQTFKEFEVIVVDDNSTDNSYEIASEYAIKDHRFKVIHHDENKGGGAARNTGTQYAIGEYIIFLDSDDYFYPNMLEAAYNKAKSVDCDICIFNTVYAVGKTPLMNFNSQYIPKKEVFNVNDIPTKVFEIFNAVPWNKLFKRAFVEGTGIHWSETMCSNDVFFVNTHLVLAEKICVLNDVLIRYENRTVENSQSKYNYYFKDAMTVYSNLRKKLIEENHFNEKIRKSFISRLLSALNWQYNSINQEDKKKFYFNWLNEEGFHELGLDEAKQEDYLINNNLSLNQYLNIKRMMEFKGDYEGYKKSFDNDQLNYNYTPVAFAINEQYAFPFSVSFLSLLENRNKNTYVEAFVLTSDDFSEHVRNDLTEAFSSYDNVKINFVTVNRNLFDNVTIHTTHLDIQTFFRLLLPNILPFLSKILYLDSDSIVCGDLYELFSRNLDNYYIMGVKAAAFMGNNAFEKRKCKELEIPSMKSYVNAGMLMMNLTKLRNDHFVDLFINLMNRSYKQEDQDVINKACYGHIRHIPLKYNCMTKYLDPMSPDISIAGQVYSISERETAKNNPLFIHFANKTKPWNDFRIFWSEIFFKYAIKSKLFSQQYYNKYDAYNNFKKLNTIPDLEHYRHFKNIPKYIEQTNNNISENNCKISIILPVYNNEKTITKTLESIIMNVSVLRECELIIVDDCSYDRTLDIVISYAQKFPFIKVYSFDDNNGSGYARNYAILKAKGEFITFIDGDDEYYDYDSLKSLYIAAKASGALICGGGMAEFKGNKKQYGQYQYPMNGYSFAVDGFVEYKNWQFDYGYHRFIYNRNFILKNNIEFPKERRYQDVLYFIRCMHLVKEFYAISKPVYLIKLHEIIFSDKHFTDFFNCITNVFDYAINNKLYSLANLTMERYVSFLPVLRESLIKSSTKKILLNKQITFLKMVNKYKGILNKSLECNISINSLVSYYYPFVKFSNLS